MKTGLRFSTVFLLFSMVLFLTGCGGSSGSVSGSAGYGVYHGYNYPYSHYGSYYDDDIDVHVDRGDVQERRQERVETGPQRQQNVHAARSHASSMGRPARSGGRVGGGRR